jgi:hypothetical protein
MGVPILNGGVESDGLMIWIEWNFGGATLWPCMLLSDPMRTNAEAWPVPAIVRQSRSER